MYGSCSHTSLPSCWQPLSSVPLPDCCPADLSTRSSLSILLAGPLGFNAVKDTQDGYQFVYPFGWQEVQVEGQDVVYKDIIEPLESVSVTVEKTDKQNVSDFGSPEEVRVGCSCAVVASNRSQVQQTAWRVSQGTCPPLAALRVWELAAAGTASARWS